MTGYLVEEFVENEPTGRSWHVSATDPLEAAAKALARVEKPCAAERPAAREGLAEKPLRQIPVPRRRAR